MSSSIGTLVSIISSILCFFANHKFFFSLFMLFSCLSLFLDLASMVLILYVGLREVVSCDFLRYVQIFGLSLMIIGVVLTIVSCVNYTISAIKQLTKEKVEAVEEVAQAEASQLTESPEYSKPVKPKSERPRRRKEDNLFDGFDFDGENKE